MTLHPLIDRPLTSLAAALRRDSRGTQGCVKERDEGLDCGVVARCVESNAMGARDKVPVTRANEGISRAAAISTRKRLWALQGARAGDPLFVFLSMVQPGRLDYGL